MSVSKDELFQRVSSLSTLKQYHHLQEYIKQVADQLGLEQCFYVYDLADILWKAQLWKEQYPNVEPFYAVKVCADPVIIRLMVLLEFGFDCSTKGEIEVVLRAGGDPRRIVFAHTVKPSSTLGWARQKGVDLLTFDCEEELHKVATHFPDARLILRLKASSVGNHNNDYDLSKKFGCYFFESERLLIKAKKLNMNLVGTSFHAGALCDNPKSYVNTILQCRSVFETARKLGFHFTILDIGAGFHGNHEREDFFVTLSHEIQKCIADNFPDPELRIIAEPGTFFISSAGMLTTAVLGKRKGITKVAKQTGMQVEYYLNSGLYGSFFRHYFLYEQHLKPLLPESEIKKRSMLRSVLWGQTPDSEDIISKVCSLPEMEVDEFIVWTNMGSYCQMLASTFAEVPLPAIRHAFIYTQRLNAKWIQNLEDIVRLVAENAVLIQNQNSFQVSNGHFLSKD